MARKDDIGVVIAYAVVEKPRKDAAFLINRRRVQQRHRRIIRKVDKRRDDACQRIREWGDRGADRRSRVERRTIAGVVHFAVPQHNDDIQQFLGFFVAEQDVYKFGAAARAAATRDCPPVELDIDPDISIARMTSR